MTYYRTGVGWFACRLSVVCLASTLKHRMRLTKPRGSISCALLSFARHAVTASLKHGLSFFRTEAMPERDSIARSLPDANERGGGQGCVAGEDST